MPCALCPVLCNTQREGLDQLLAKRKATVVSLHALLYILPELRFHPKLHGTSTSTRHIHTPIKLTHTPIKLSTAAQCTVHSAAGDAPKRFGLRATPEADCALTVPVPCALSVLLAPQD